MKLLTTQKDEIYDLIINQQLSPAQFEFVEINSVTGHSDIATKLFYKDNSDFFFIFDSGSNTMNPHWCMYAPDEDRYQNKEYPGSWRGIERSIEKWLACLKKEIKSENKWQKLEEELNKFNFKFEDNNDQFSVLEYEEIDIKINLIKGNLSTLCIPAAQLERIEKNLDYLKDKAKVLGKFDWKTLFVGTIVNLALEYAMSPETIHAFIKIIKDALSQLFLK